MQGILNAHTMDTTIKTKEIDITTLQIDMIGFLLLDSPLSKNENLYINVHTKSC